MENLEENQLETNQDEILKEAETKYNELLTSIEKINTEKLDETSRQYIENLGKKIKEEKNKYIEDYQDSMEKITEGDPDEFLLKLSEKNVKNIFESRLQFSIDIWSKLIEESKQKLNL